MACCSCFSSHGHGLARHLRLLTSSSPARIRLVPPSAPSPRRRSRLLSPVVCCAPDDLTAAPEEEDDRYGFQIQVSKAGGKRNRRAVRARVRVDAPLEAVWATLTDYEGLADFIPGLAECRLLHRDHRFARLYQVGEQDLALGFKFNAKGTVDCYEGDMELLPAEGARRREIAFRMIDGDFKVFEGKWSVHEVVDSATLLGGEVPSQEFQTTLSYLVELEPKLWVPVRLLEGRICSEIKTNLLCIRDQAHKIQTLLHHEDASKYNF